MRRTRPTTSNVFREMPSILDDLCDFKPYHWQRQATSPVVERERQALRTALRKRRQLNSKDLQRAYAPPPIRRPRTSRGGKKRTEAPAAAPFKPPRPLTVRPLLTVGTVRPGTVRPVPEAVPPRLQTSKKTLPHIVKVSASTPVLVALEAPAPAIFPPEKEQQSVIEWAAFPRAPILSLR